MPGICCLTRFSTEANSPPDFNENQLSKSGAHIRFGVGICDLRSFATHGGEMSKYIQGAVDCYGENGFPDAPVMDSITWSGVAEHCTNAQGRQRWTRASCIPFIAGPRIT